VKRMLLKMVMAAAAGSLLISSAVFSQTIPPPAKKAAHVEIIQGPELEVARGDLADRGVHRDRPVPLLPAHRVIVETGHGHRDALFGQPVQRVQQLHVLEVIGGQHEDPALGELHGTDLTRGPFIRP